MFRSLLDAACSQSKLLSPKLSDEEISDIRAELERTLQAWRELAVGESLTLHLVIADNFPARKLVGPAKPTSVPDGPRWRPAT